MKLQLSSTDISRVDRWLEEQLERTGNSLRMEKIAAVLGLIWKSRNDRIFRSKNPNTEEPIEKADTLLCSYKRWNKRDEKAMQNQPHLQSVWVPPKNRALKINIDGSFDAGCREAAIAGVLRDGSGTLLEGFTEKIQACSPLHAEARALVGALKFFGSRSGEELYLETDRKALIDADRQEEEMNEQTQVEFLLNQEHKRYQDNIQYLIELPVSGDCTFKSDL
ncbi:uncharacterized protein LOC125312974 [Rhodamnia argentea]|uniref:Uncharacterized protein LOC125312974 n=1 Tax=Rhodamnia argentea TaxID=178133 RepID=A0ABM3GXF2_9MYRT|nr:uncharacterized protein LOC125312974 [Rhodamnia argentea]